MTEFCCPLCHERRTPRSDDVVRVWHTCALSPDEPVEMTAGGRTFKVYCGDYDCPSRAELVLWSVRESELVDGEVWLCPRCEPAVVDVETERT